MKWTCFLLVLFMTGGWSVFSQNYSILNGERYACILDADGKKIDSLKIPKLTPDIKFASDSSIIVSLHQIGGDSLGVEDKGFMLMFYAVKERKLKELFSYPVTTADAIEMQQVQIRLGQSSILLSNGSIHSNAISIPVRSCIRKPDLIRKIKLLEIK